VKVIEKKKMDPEKEGEENSKVSMHKRGRGGEKNEHKWSTGGRCRSRQKKSRKENRGRGMEVQLGGPGRPTNQRGWGGQMVFLRHNERTVWVG